MAWIIVSLKTIVIVCTLVFTANTQFVTHPEDLAIEEGLSTRMSCEVYSNHTAANTYVQWYRGEKSITIELTNRYSYVDPEHGDSGNWAVEISQVRLDEDDTEFRCQLHEGQTVIGVSNTGYLSVLVPPQSFSVDYTGSPSSPDGMAQFTGIVNSSKPYATIKWFLEETDITSYSTNVTVPGNRDKTTTTLSFLSYPFQPANNEMYLKSEASIPDIPYHELIENYLHLYDNVTVDSSLSPGDSTVVVKQGDTLPLECRASGYPEPLYRWYIITAENDEIDFPVNQSTFDMTDINFDDEGLYSCEAQSLCGSYKALNNLSVIVLVPAKSIEMTLTGVPVNDSILVNEGTYILACIVEESNPYAKIAWRLDGDEIGNANTTLEELPSGKKTTHSHVGYMFTSQDNNKTFGCYADVESFDTMWQQGQVYVQDQTAEVFTSTVDEAPNVDSLKLEVGDKLQLKCEAHNIFFPNFKWLCDTFIIDNQVQKILTIPSVKAANEGSYKCHVTNAAGEYSSTNSLYVRITNPDASHMAVILSVVFGVLAFILLSIVLLAVFKRKTPCCKSSSFPDQNGNEPPNVPVAQPVYEEPRQVIQLNGKEHLDSLQNNCHTYMNTSNNK